MRTVLAPLEANEAFVSTGQLPDPQKVTAIVTEAYEHFRSNPDGTNSDVYPALQRVGSNLFGVCVVATGGNVFAIGDADYEFAIMSVSKPLFLRSSVSASVPMKSVERSAQMPRGCRQLTLRCGGEHIRPNKPHGERRRDCDDQPRSRLVNRSKVGVHL